MSLKLYFDKMSQPSRALLLFVRANKAVMPCMEVPVALRKGEQRQEAFLKINPFHRVPVIDHDGFKLSESEAILRYLCRAFPVADHWYPNDSHAMARVDAAMAWHHITLRVNGFQVFRERFLEPKKSGLPVNQVKVAMFTKILEEVMDQIETIWLKDNLFVAGPELTIADLLIISELEQQGKGMFDVRKGYPKITEYMQRVRERLQPHYDDVHDIIRIAEKVYASQLKDIK